LTFQGTLTNGAQRVPLIAMSIACTSVMVIGECSMSIQTKSIPESAASSVIDGSNIVMTMP